MRLDLAATGINKHDFIHALERFVKMLKKDSHQCDDFFITHSDYHSDIIEVTYCFTDCNDIFADNSESIVVKP